MALIRPAQPGRRFAGTVVPAVTGCAKSLGPHCRFGHEIQLQRYLFTAEQVASQLEAAGLHEVCRLVRAAQGMERDDQAILLAKAQ